MKLTASEISFEIKGKPRKFTVYHNLPNTPGLSIKDAAINWAARTWRYTAKDLVKYVLSKNKDSICMTQEDFENYFG